MQSNSSYSKNKISNALKANKTITNENSKLKYSMNNVHKKTLSNQIKIKGIIDIDKTNKTNKITSTCLE